MKLNNLLAFIAVLFLFAQCHKTPENRNSVVVGERDSLYSKILSEERQILVSVPKPNTGSNFAPQQYPVIYLLDGDAHFLSVVAMVQYLSDNGICPEMIVVGIPNTDRARDLTPSHSMIVPDGGGPKDFLKTTGGAGKFTEFLEKELMPYVGSKYPAAPYKLLIGHSFGGLFAINTLIHHPDLFNSYVAIDPSMWWDGHRLLRHADTVLKKENFAKKMLFLSVANTMADGMDTSRVAADTAISSSHIRSILQLAKQLISNPNNGLRSDWKYYDNDDHGSVPFISEYDALHFIFSYYKPRDIRGETTVEQLNAHYKMVSEHLGYSVSPNEAYVNQLGYNFMQQKKMDKAFEFLNLNTVNFPKSPNVWDSMGDYYLEEGETAKAAEMFSKSLELMESAPTRAKLDATKRK